MRAHRDSNPIRAWWIAAVILILGGSATPAASQGLIAPSGHWGALMFPEAEPLNEFGLSFDRFTPYGKVTDKADTAYNAIDENMGLNFAHFSWSTPLRRRSGILRVIGQLGYAADQPTEFLQNDFLHHNRNLGFIREVPSRSGVEWGVSAESNFFFDTRPTSRRIPLAYTAPVFVGAGGALSSVYHELFVQGGIRAQNARWRNASLPAPSFMVRAGLAAVGSEAFPDSTVSNGYIAWQASVRIPLDRWWEAGSVLPEIEVGYSKSTGLFQRSVPDGTGVERIAETMCTVAFKWAGGDFTAETYNDTCGQKDKGPSFGIRTYVRWRRNPLRDMREGT
jgi:hypothetical protein